MKKRFVFVIMMLVCIMSIIFALGCTDKEKAGDKNDNATDGAGSAVSDGNTGGTDNGQTVTPVKDPLDGFNYIAQTNGYYIWGVKDTTKTEYIIPDGTVAIGKDTFLNVQI